MSGFQVKFCHIADRITFNFLSLSPLRKVIIYKNLRFLSFVSKLDVLIVN